MNRSTKVGVLAASAAGVLVLGAPGAYADATVTSGTATAKYVSSTNTMQMSKTTCDLVKFTVDYKFRSESGNSVPAKYSTITGPSGCGSTSKVLAPSGKPYIVFRVCLVGSGCSGWASTNA